MQKNIIIGTAGHIDHGKSTLIKALTGDDTDRLKEEKERGISIELGFSHLLNQKSKENNLNLGIVDVPGHQKFVNKMLAAAGGIDLALIVIAADEGVMPQTKEHLEILNILNVKKAVIALNKIDLVEKEWIELVKADIREQFAGTFAEDAKIIKVSAVEKSNIEKLEAELIKMALKIKKNSRQKLPYFPIDRVFSLSGQGTIVTGTLLRGEIKKGKEMMIYPQAKELKIRSLENHQQQQEIVSSGSRVGINISGLNKKEIKTGDIIAQKDSLLNSNFFEAEIRLLDDLNFTVKNGDKVHLHTAAAERIAVIYIYGKTEIFPGEKAYIKLKVKEELALFYQEKYILRRFSPVQTIGGGKILEIDPPPRRKNKAEEVIKLLSNLETTDFKKALGEFIYQKKNCPVKLSFLQQKTAVKKRKLENNIEKLINENQVIKLGEEKSYIHQKNLEKLNKKILKYITNYHKKYHLKKGIKKEELRSKLSYKITKREISALLNILKKKGLLKEENNLIAMKKFTVKLNSQEKEIENNILKEFQTNLFAPPTREEIITKYQNKELLEYLEREDILLRVTDKLDFHPDVLKKSKILLKKYFNENKKIELSEFRDLIKSSRRYALPLLEKLDKIKITKREGDLRFAGKKLLK